MNVRQVFEAKRPDDDVLGDLQRIMQIWAEASARFGGGGDFLFGDFGAAEIMFAPVVTRIVTNQLPVPRFAPAYMNAVLDQDRMSVVWGTSVSVRVDMSVRLSL